VFLKRFIHYLVDLVYPPRCPLCGAFSDDKSPCEPCKSSLHKLDADADLPHVKTRYVDRCISSFAYEGVLRIALQDFKYAKRLDQVSYFGKELAHRLSDFESFDIIVPVPMRAKKLKARGFNQAALLAKQVSKGSGCGVLYGAIKRVRDDEAQVGLERRARLENVKGSFEIGGTIPKDAKILLIDDVLTTGATINECARVLKSAGASKVFAATVARAL